ncbi:hypothetical protein [Bacillus sp. FJAT-45350]|uniref:hypothetical protein n=1 Tax=Bacillus sp. FJAT-45350 TaxID=2011014 RepID=UPI000BB84931|nr:hypothetical protein [Bacillus sp. FJAT-45350]
MPFISKDSKFYSFVEPLVYFFLLLFFYIGGYFLVTHATSSIQERVHEYNASQFSKIVKLHLATGELEPVDGTIYFSELIELGLLGDDEAFVSDIPMLSTIKSSYSPASFVRVVRADNQPELQVRLCMSSIEDCVPEKAVYDTIEE